MVRGHGVLRLPFSSGHILALQVFPQNDFAPYKKIWHRLPDGRWFIFVDGPRAETACPRYFGAAATASRLAPLTVKWMSPRSLEIDMQEPRLRWTISMVETPLFQLLNALNPRIPERFLRRTRSLKAKEWIARTLMRMGEISLLATTPNGQSSILLTRRLYGIAESEVTVAGEDLGHPVRLEHSRSFGPFRLPARPIFAEGLSYFQILDMNEYRRLRRELGEI